MQIEENGGERSAIIYRGNWLTIRFLPTPLQSLRQLNLTEETYRTLSACSRKLGSLKACSTLFPTPTCIWQCTCAKKRSFLRKLREPSARLTTYLVHRKHNSIIKMSQTS